MFELFIWFNLFGLQSPQLVEHLCSATTTRDLNKIIIIIIIIIIIVIIIIVVIIIIIIIIQCRNNGHYCFYTVYCSTKTDR